MNSLQITIRRTVASTAVLMAFGHVPAFSQDVDVAKLDSIVVTAGGFQQAITEAPASITVITREELEKSPIKNIGEAVSKIEGVSVERGGKTGGMNISMRGLGSDYTLILVDGKRVNRNSSGARPNGFGDVDTSFMPPVSAIERIEVVRGPMSTLYGSDAMGGVINIITRKVAKEWHGSFTLDGTIQGDRRFGDSLGTSFYLSGPIKEDLFGISFYGRHDHHQSASESYPVDADEARTGKYTGDIADNGLTKSTVQMLGVRLALTPTKNHDLMLDIEQGRQTYDNGNQQLGELSSLIPAGQAGGGYSDEQKFNKTRYGLTHLGRYGNLSSDSSIVYETTETKGRTNPMSFPRLATDGDARKLKYDNLVIDSKWNLSLLDGTHNLTFGGQWREQKFVDGLVSAPLNLKQTQWALFAENEWRIVDDFALTLGARYDQNEQFGGNWSPRAYAVWNASPLWTVKGGVSRGYKTPDLNIMTDGIIGLRGQGTMPIIGSSQLKPERSTSSELGIYFDNGEGYRANATVFHTTFKDKLLSNTVPNCRAQAVAGCLDLGDWKRRGKAVDNFFRWENVDEARVKGIELGGAMPITQAISIRGNYTLTNSERKTGINMGQPLTSDPRHMLNLGVDWKINEKTNAWISAEYRAKQFAGINAEEQHVFYDPYWLVGVGGSYQARKNITLTASVDNLFNKNFVNYGDTKAYGTTAWTNSYFRILEGRRFWVSANISF